MSAHDALERLLELRRGLERQEEMKLAVAGKRLQDARAAVQQAQLARLNHCGLAPQQEMSGAELRWGSHKQAVARERQRHLEAILAEARTAHHAQLEALMERTRQRKILETLNERHRAARERERLRREQARLDESFLTRLQYDLPLQNTPKADRHRAEEAKPGSGTAPGDLGRNRA